MTLPAAYTDKNKVTYRIIEYKPSIKKIRHRILIFLHLTFLFLSIHKIRSSVHLSQQLINAHNLHTKCE